MKNLFVSALALSAATLTFAPVANAAEGLPSNSIQQRRLEFLDTQTKAVENIQSARLDALDARTKNSVHKLRIEHLNTQTKAVDNIQEARLDALDARTKSVVR